MVSVNWLLNDEPMSPKDSLALELADDLLVGTSAATLRKALTDSGLGESVIGGGLSSELLQNTYSIGLKVRGGWFWLFLGCTGMLDTFFLFGSRYVGVRRYMRFFGFLRFLRFRYVVSFLVSVRSVNGFTPVPFGL